MLQRVVTAAFLLICVAGGPHVAHASTVVGSGNLGSISSPIAGQYLFQWSNGSAPSPLLSFSAWVGETDINVFATNSPTSLSSTSFFVEQIFAQNGALNPNPVLQNTTAYGNGSFIPGTNGSLLITIPANTFELDWHGLDDVFGGAVNGSLSVLRLDPVPIPGSLPLFTGGLLMLALVRGRFRFKNRG